MFWNIIFLNSAWAIKLINKLNDEEVINAFRITIGHELGHKEKHINRLFYLRDLKFLSWVIEVYCDFYGTKIMAGGNKYKLINAIDFKSNNRNINYEDVSHPSWNRRLEYVKYGNFNEMLIEKIYNDTKCNNKKLLYKVINFYKNRYIILN